jgi:hypothetical protein
MLERVGVVDRKFSEGGVTLWKDDDRGSYAAVVAEEPEDLKVERERGGVRARRRDASRGNPERGSATA